MDVPRPNSSIIINELLVPCLTALLVSSISIKKVDLPSTSLSLAPIRVNILSTIDNLHLEAGTKHPIYAKIGIIHVILSNVLFPPMFGPVSRRRVLLSSEVALNLPNLMSLGMKLTPTIYKQGCHAA